TGWWGAVCAIVVLSTVLGVLFYSYFYIRLYSDEWPQGGIARPPWLGSGALLMMMLLSSAFMLWARRSLHVGLRMQTYLSLGCALLLGGIFVAGQVAWLAAQDFTLASNAYGSVFHVISVVLLAIVVMVLLMAAALLARLGEEFEHRHGFVALQMQVTGMLWHFSVIAAVAVYLVLYVSPLLI